MTREDGRARPRAAMRAHPAQVADTLGGSGPERPGAPFTGPGRSTGRTAGPREGTA
ncbi:hypothetical protein [Actinomadura chibensis]|uniref:hypothetical protein n=1 Tax=Actinomadura chibensis TaxID=392828 RepID=UPI000A81A790|nr:hypothetical protein [Actinomadura chibensis]